MSVTVHCLLSPRVEYDLPPEFSNIVPRRVVSLTPEEAVPYKGFLRVPQIGVKATTLVSAAGLTFSDRDGLDSINWDSWASFIVDESYWDGVTGFWTPIRDSSPVIYQIEGTPGDYPAYNTIEYRSGKELFLQDALTLDTQTISTNFNNGNDDAIVFTLGMAMIPLSADINDMVVFSDDSTIGITPTGFTATMDGRSWGVSIPSGPMKISPLYLVFNVTPNVATLSIGFSPSLIYQGSSAVQRDVTSLDFTISSPMHLFSVDVWSDNAPSSTDIISRYASILGSSVSAIGSFA